MRYTATNQRISIAAAAAAAVVATAATAAFADPWVPPAGAGKDTISVRTSSSDQRFASDSYGTATTTSSSTLTTTELRVVGEQGIGHGMAVRYDLRAAALTKTGATSTATSTGVEDQEIGLVAGIYQSHDFAMALGLNVLAPTGSTSSAPALGSGSVGFEPDVMIGQRFGDTPHESYVSITTGPRYYGGGAGRLDRLALSIGTRIAPRLEIEGVGSMTHGLAPIGTVGPASYDLTRVGAVLGVEMSKHTRISFGFEDPVAGRNVRAGTRLEFGVTIR